MVVGPAGNRRFVGVWAAPGAPKTVFHFSFFESDLGLKLGQAKLQIQGTVPADRHAAIPNDSDPVFEKGYRA